jgi:hypothetical protein
MNELQRQAYLSVFGIENYMPRWHLPCAPESVACVLPAITPALEMPSIQVVDAALSQPQIAIATSLEREPPQRLLADIVTSSSAPVRISVASILQQLEEKPVDIAPHFSLSVWRPAPGFLIIDSRNTALALPTELLLHNILRAFIGNQLAGLQEEVLRWPMVENRFVSRTVIDARAELQTWLAVEHELRPVTQLWLMGDNAARYLVTGDSEPTESWWQRHSLPSIGLPALILPGLNQLLQQPQLKARMWMCIQ